MSSDIIFILTFYFFQ